MIGGMTEHDGHPKLAAHLAKLENHESITIRTHGLSATTIGEAIAELRLMGLGCRTAKPLIHAWASPSIGYSEADWEHHRAAFEAEFGLEGFPHMTVGQNIAYPLEVRGVSRSERVERVQKILGMMRLDGFIDRRPAELSGGQRQRVAVARALVFNPELVLMDEPLGALDKQLREAMQYEIKRIHEQFGITTIYVTHDQTEALVMSDRVAVFNDGVIQQLAPPDAIYEQPANAFVASFIGDNNLIPGRVVRAGNGSVGVEVEGWGTIDAVAGGTAATGDRVTLSIRPERVVVAADRVESGQCWPARVAEVTYVGDHFRIVLAIAGDRSIVAKVGHLDSGRLQKGQSVTFGFAERHCRCLDGSAGPLAGVN